MLPLADNENIVVDPKKYQSIAIFLRALKVTCEDVSKAILDGKFCLSFDSFNNCSNGPSSHDCRFNHSLC